jgi:hypothetical protein
LAKYYDDNFEEEEEMGGTGSTHGRDHQYIQNFGRKTYREEATFETYACRWKDSIKMDLREIGWEDVDWMHLAKDRDK